MPSPKNITRPITLISNGRSGSSLTMNIIGAHRDVHVCGETAQMLFGVWHSVERAKGVVRPDRELGPKADFRLRCAKAVRATFLSMFEDDAPEWMQKPIGVPWVFRQLDNAPSRPASKIGWYWDVMHHSFPESRNITILRHPYDVVLSAADYWGMDHTKAWKGIVMMAKIINHADSDIGFALSHARLVNDPEPEVRRLLDHLGLAFDPACVKATERVYVPRKSETRIPKEDEPELTSRGFSRQEKWANIDMSGFTAQDRNVLQAMWARFGEELEF